MSLLSYLRIQVENACFTITAHHHGRHSFRHCPIPRVYRGIWREKRGLAKNLVK